MAVEGDELQEKPVFAHETRENSFSPVGFGILVTVAAIRMEVVGGDLEAREGVLGATGTLRLRA